MIYLLRLKHCPHGPPLTTDEYDRRGGFMCTQIGANCEVQIRGYVLHAQPEHRGMRWRHLGRLTLNVGRH